MGESFGAGNTAPYPLLRSFAEGDLSWVSPMQRAAILDEMQGAERSNSTAIARLCNAADRRNHGCDARGHPRQVALVLSAASRRACGPISPLWFVIRVPTSLLASWFEVQLFPSI